MESDRLSILKKTLSSCEKQHNLIRSIVSLENKGSKENIPLQTQNSSSEKLKRNKIQFSSGVVSSKASPVGSSKNVKKCVELALRELILSSPCKESEANVNENKILYESPSNCNLRSLNSSFMDEGYVTANERSTSKSFNGDEEYKGFSITKSGCWSELGNTIDFDNMSSLQSPNEYNKASQCKSPKSSSKTLRHEMELEQKNEEIRMLSDRLSSSETELAQKDLSLSQVVMELGESEARRQMAEEEVAALTFFSSLQEQKIAEYENILSSSRMDHNELMSSKTRKHKAALKRLKEESAGYAERANSMIQQMNDQMSMLQKMAMDRIETLEGDIMTLRRANEELEQEAEACRAAVIAANQAVDQSHQSSEPASLFDTLESFSTIASPQQQHPSEELQFDDWASPPAKFSKRNDKSSRRSSAMFGCRPNAHALPRAKHFTAQYVVDAGENDCDSADGDNDTVVDEAEETRSIDSN